MFRISVIPLLTRLTLGLFCVGACATVCGWQQNLGYDDTPIIPGTPWHVHDGKRPQPRIVTAGEAFSQQAKPPSDAVALFDGSDLSKWESSRGGEARWKVDDGHFETAIPYATVISGFARWANTTRPSSVLVFV